MFQSSNKIDPRLARDVEKIEQIYGYQVLSAKLFSTPVLTISVVCEVSKPRLLTLLEEFVLRTAIEFEQTPLSSLELAELLGVDNRFIQYTVDTLTPMSLKKSPDALLATDEGKEFYAKGQIPQPPQTVNLRLGCIFPLTEFVLLPKNQKTPSTIELDDVPPLPYLPVVDDEVIQDSINMIDKSVVIKTTHEAGHPIQDLDEGIVLQGVNRIDFLSQQKAYWGVLVIRDVLDDTINIQVLNWHNESVMSARIPQIEGYINQMLDSKTLQLSDLMQADPAEIDEIMRITSEMVAVNALADEASRVLSVEQLVKSEISDIRMNPNQEFITPKTNSGSAELVRDGSIRPVFLDSLQQAKKRILIVSPWMNEQAVDDKLIDIFTELAQKHVISVLGWGISRNKGDEEKPPSDSLLAKLAKITTSQGLPAVPVIWLGNQHIKEVIIDDKIHLCGSHNWLSYRGDFYPRGESVYRITIPEPVQVATNSIKKLFIKQLANEWEKILTNPDKKNIENNLLRLISAWIGLDQFETAAEYAVKVSLSHLYLAPLMTLIASTTERLFGANPQTRLELLNIFGLYWSSENVTSNHMNHPSIGQLSKNIRLLMQRIAKEDDLGLSALIDLYKYLWIEINVLDASESIEQFIKGAISQSPKIELTSKTTNNKKKGKKK